MANKDTTNRSGAVPKDKGPGFGKGTSKRTAGEWIARSKAGGVYSTGDWRTDMGAHNATVASNGRSANPNRATGSTRTSPEVSLEYTNAKAVNKALSTDGGDARTNIAGRRKPKANLYP